MGFTQLRAQAAEKGVKIVTLFNKLPFEEQTDELLEKVLAADAKEEPEVEEKEAPKDLKPLPLKSAEQKEVDRLLEIAESL